MGESRIAMITGAAGTMGTAVARGLADEGVKIVLADLKRGPLEKLARELPVETFISVFDVSDEHACHEAVAHVRNERGGVASGHGHQPRQRILPDSGMRAGDESERMGSGHKRGLCSHADGQ